MARDLAYDGDHRPPPRSERRGRRRERGARAARPRWRRPLDRPTPFHRVRRRRCVRLVPRWLGDPVRVGAHGRARDPAPRRRVPYPGAGGHGRLGPLPHLPDAGLVAFRDVDLLRVRQERRPRDLDLVHPRRGRRPTHRTRRADQLDELVSGRALDRLRRRPLRELRHLEGGRRDPAGGPPHEGQALRGLPRLDARLPAHPLRPPRRCVGGPRRDRGRRHRREPSHGDRGPRLLRLRGGGDARLSERVSRRRLDPLPFPPERLDQLLARAARGKRRRRRSASGRPGRGRPERRDVVSRRALDRLHREPQRTPRPARRIGGRRRAEGARVTEGRRRVEPLVGPR